MPFKMNIRRYILVFCLIFIGKTFAYNDTTFRAAVYEHPIIFPKGVKSWVNRSVALANMMKNVKSYNVQADLAGKQVRTL